MLENLKKYRVILASQSPRRRELLSGLGIDFEVRLLQDIDESYPESLKGEDIPLHIARTKAAAYLPSLKEDELLITADTIVWLDEKVLGKPGSEEEAKEMLRTLSGRTHYVMTGVSITTPGRQHCFACTSEVQFDTLSDEEIDFYVRRFRPLDKAGSYGVQEWIGYIGVQSIKGSYFNIMGLPVQRLYCELKKW